MTRIDLYPIPRVPRLKIEPGKKARDWMSPHAYKCLPIVAANAFGWDIILAEDVVYSWNGGPGKDDLVVTQGGRSAKSQFGLGTVTFSVGYSWKTEPGVHLMVGPVPNPDFHVHQLFHTISAVVETDTLKYPWFVSVRSLRKGDCVIPAGTVLARVYPVRLSDVAEAVIAEAAEPEDFLATRERHAKDRYANPNAWLRFYHDEVNHPSVRAPTVERLDTEDMLVNNGILAIPEYLTEEECRTVAAIIEGEAPERKQSTDYWKGKTFDFTASTFPPELYDKLTNGVHDAVCRFYGEERMDMEHPHLVRWRKGDMMRPHSDHAQGKFPWRDYAVLIYLTDDYEGGELVIPAYDLEIVPKAGSLVAFPGGKMFHGVKEITSGTRKTCITWFRSPSNDSPETHEAMLRNRVWHGKS